MLEIIADILILYAYLFFIGIGLWIFLTPKFLRQKCLFPTLPVLFGLIIQLITNIYYIAFNFDVTKSINLCVILGIITLIPAIRFRKEIFLEELKKLKQVEPGTIAQIILITVISLIILSPVLKAGYPTTPYRAGIDQIGYAETAKFFMKGGTVKQVENEIKNELNIKNTNELIDKEYNILNYNKVLHFAFLSKWPRWGYSSIIASFSSLIHIDHPYQIEFILLIIPSLILFSSGYFVVRHIFNKSKSASFLVSTALILNCNLINIYYEGHYAQIMAMPFLFLLLVLYLWQRQPENFENMDNKARIQLFGFISVLISGIFCIYTESLSLFIAFVIVSSLFDVILIRKINIYRIIYNFTALIAGCIITLPYLLKWLPVVKHTKFVLHQISSSGIWQPKWAFISEIVGLSNIYVPEYYRKSITYLVERSSADLFLNLAISLIIIGFICVLMLNKKDFDKSFWLTIPAFLAMVFYKTFYIEQTHNYQYMKTYTLFAPLLIILLFLSTDYCCERFCRIKRSINIIKYAIFFIIIANGLVYTENFIKTGSYVTKNMYNIEDIDKTANFDSYAMLIHKNIKTQMLIPFFNFNWIQERNAFSLKSHLSKKICLIKNTEQLRCKNCFIKENLKNIIFIDSDYIFVNTGKTVKETYFTDKNQR